MGKTLEEYINEKTICSLSDKEIHISDELLKTPLEDFSDGYHTFKELYDNRAKLFAVICHDHKDLAWKSKKHFSDKDPMYDGMFIVGIETPMGPASYHYNIDPYWDIFDVPELDHGLYYDGYSPDQAILS